MVKPCYYGQDVNYDPSEVRGLFFYKLFTVCRVERLNGAQF